MEGDRAITIGDAAHITAAAPGGPRYDAALTPEQRSGADNGLWACKNHHWIIDHDKKRYTVGELVRIKANAEESARRLQGIEDMQGVALAAATIAAREASERMIEQWRIKYRFDQTEVIELDFREAPREGAGTSTWTLAQVGSAVAQGHKLVLTGPPGAGKTITLIQLAERLAVNVDGPVPLIFSVSGWLASNRDLASYISGHLANAGVSADAVSLLFSTGRLSILLNGWNEAPETEQARASEQLTDFLLNNGLIGLVLSTRATRHSPALIGETVLEILPLTLEKKKSIVEAARLPDSETFLRQIASNRILSEITQTPLFLAAAIKLARAGRPIPATRSEILESFLANLLDNDHHAARLMAAPCQDCHYRYQTDIAVAMTRQGVTELPSARVQLIIGTTSRSLIETGIIGQAGAASAVAESLAQHHALLYLPDGGPGYGFLHQQFQEWFASRWLLDELRRLAAHPVSLDIFSLQRDCLNRPAWAEAIGFAMESLISARETDTAAALVRWMMPVDLIRAAELAGMGGPELWAIVGAEMATALRNWHRLGGTHSDCALTAVLASGRPDFADLVWPKLEAGEQSMLHVCRLHGAFRVAVLGAGWSERISASPESREALFLSEIAEAATADEIGYAMLRAQHGPPKVRVAALNLLAEHGQFTRIVEILFDPKFGDWSEDIYHHVVSHVPVELLAPHAETVRKKFDATDSLLLRAGIVKFLKRTEHPQWVELAQAELNRALAASQGAPLVLRTHGAPTSLEMRTISFYTEMLWQSHSAWMADWLISSFGENLPNLEPLNEWLKFFSEDALVALATRIVATDERDYRQSAGVDFLLRSGSARAAAVLINAYVSAKVAGREPLDLPRIHDGLQRSASVQLALVDGILSHSENVTEFQELKALIDAISPVTALDGSLGEQIEPRQRDPLRKLVMRASDSISSDEDARSYRPHFAVVLGSLGAPQDVAVVSRWIADENARWENHQRQVAAASTSHPPRRIQYYGTSWWNWYAGALALFRCRESEAEFFHWLEHPWLPAEGAKGLVQLSLLDGSLPRSSEHRPFRRAVQLPSRALDDIGPAVRPRADAIVRAIERLEALPADNSARHYLPEMAAAVARLNDPRAIERLLALDGALNGWTPLEAFISMQSRGTVLPGRRIARTLESFIASHEVYAHGPNNDQWHAVVKALRVLLFSDEPAIAVERIRRLPASRMNSYQARDIFALLAESAAPEAASLLIEYTNAASLHGDTFGQLMEALATSPDPRCRVRLIELLHVPEEKLPGRSSSNLHRCILRAAERDEAFRRQLTEAVRNKNVQWKYFLGFERFGDAVGLGEHLEALLREPDLRPLEEELRQVIDRVSETHEPAGSEGTYYVFPADAAAIKKQLARLLPGGGHNAEVASRLLAFVRLKRAQRGQPANEPLHPDISMLEAGVASWPISGC